MKLIFTFWLSFLISVINAQIPTLEWVKGLESNFEKRITDGDLDQQNNIYIKGFFKSKLDFDPGPDSFNLITQGIGDGFVLSLNSYGNFIWAKQLPTENENGTSAIFIHDTIAFVTGRDFGLSVLQTKYILNSNDTIIHYVNSGNDIEVDYDGNIILCGDFNQPQDFDPSLDTLLITPIGDGDAFISKLSATGDLIWVNQIGGTGYASGISVHVDNESGILVTGQFLENLDLDPSQPGYELMTDGNWNSFIIKYNSNGDLLWYKLIGGTGMNRVTAVAYDNYNNIILGGNFSGFINFKDIINPSFFNSTGGDDIFMAQLDADGNYNWIQVIGGPESQYLGDISIDKTGRIFTLGEFYGEVDFDPGIEQHLLTSQGFTDIFIQEYSFDGEYRNTYQIPGPDFEFGTKLLFDNEHNMVVLGQYGKSVDFDLTSETSYNSALGASDTFIAKYSICNSKDTLIELSNCDSLSINGEKYFSGGQYVQNLTTLLGCDSIMYLNVTIDYSTDSLVTAEICQGDQFEGYTETGTYQDTFQSSNGCDSIRTLILQVLPNNDPACFGTSTTFTQLDRPSIYPNPTSGDVYIENFDPTYTLVQILSIHGKVLQEFSLHDSTVVGIANLPSGIYMFRFSGIWKSIIMRVCKD